MYLYPSLGVRVCVCACMRIVHGEHFGDCKYNECGYSMRMDRIQINLSHFVAAAFELTVCV